MPLMPRRIFSDKGLEFLAGDVKKFIKNAKIEQCTANDPNVKAGVAERFIRTIKGRLYKYFTFNKTRRWVDVLPHLVTSLNSTKNRATDMRPIDVNLDNANELWERLYGNIKDNHKDDAYEKGDQVRIAKQRTPFHKSYLPNYTDQVFEVGGLKAGSPHTYELKTKEGDPVTGRFYKHEMSRTQEHRETKLEIEKVLKTRKKRGLTEYFVKWKDLPVEEASWITYADVVPA